MLEINIDLVNRTRIVNSSIEKKLQKTFHRLAVEVLNNFGLKDKVLIEILLVGENFIRNLNKTYRAVDKSTTVLSFPQTSNPQGLLGTVVLCPAKIQGGKENLDFYLEWGLKNLIEGSALIRQPADRQKII